MLIFNHPLAGHFTTSEHIQVIGLPIISKSGDLNSPAPILVFTPVYGVDTSKGPQDWKKEVAFKDDFRLIHDVRILPKTNGDLDMILVAGREGIVLLWFDKGKNNWQYNVVGTGLPRSGNNPYWGSGSVDICRVADDEIGYIATCEVSQCQGCLCKADRSPRDSTVILFPCTRGSQARLKAWTL
jgi:hypothetical protein